MAEITLNRAERKELIVGLIRNCAGWDREDIDLLVNMSNDKLLAHASGCAQLIANADPEDDSGLPGSLEPASAGEEKSSATSEGMDEEELDGDGGEDGPANTHPDEELDQPTMKKKEGVTENHRMTVNQYLERMPKQIRSVVVNALKFEHAQKKQLVQTITANSRNRFSDEFLMSKTLEELQLLAELAGPTNNRSPMFVGAAGGPVLNMEPVDRDDILVPPTLEFSRN